MTLAIAALNGLSVATSGLAAPAVLKTLPGHRPQLPPGLAAKGELTGTNELRLAIGLALRDGAGLEQFLNDVYDPASPSFHQYLTPDEFTARFGPTTNDYEAVIDFVHANGLRVTETHGNRLLLDVQGPVHAIEKALHIVLLNYRHPKEPRDFFAPDTEPSVPADLAITDISGLNNYALPHPHSVPKAPAATANPIPLSGSSPSGSYMGGDFRAAYLPGVTLDGTGQMVGLLQFDGFYPNDISAYATAAGLPQVPIKTVLLDGYNGVPTTGANSGNSEVSLDIEMAMSMAPGLSAIVVFEAGPSGNPNDILNRMAASNQVKQLSCSWGWSGGPTTTTDNIFKQMAAQGQSFLQASGDSDAFTPGANSSNGVDSSSNNNTPSSSPYITTVGGTTLGTSGPGGAWASETVWNWGSHSGGYVGSSGGISSYYAIPTWQTGISMSANGGSTTHRNIPDVALTGDNVYVLSGNGSSGDVGGTSCAAPLWAGLAALINQQAAAAGKAAVGFLNPNLYTIGKGANYNSSFHDITTGNNTWPSSPNLFYATAGYDLCTGWGTPAGQALIDALAGTANVASAPPLVQNGGFESGTFSGWTLVGDTTTSSTIYNAVEAASAQPTAVHSGNYGVFLGDTQIATLSQTLATVPGQYYRLSFWLNNPTSGTVQRFAVNWNTNASNNTLLSLVNPPAFSWTNMQFVVRATGTSTVLQFQAENDPAGFGLDDISVTPLPQAATGELTKSGNNAVITWTTTVGVMYQLQYRNDLQRGSWANLGGPFQASGSSSAITDTNALQNSAQRWYRLVAE